MKEKEEHKNKYLELKESVKKVMAEWDLVKNEIDEIKGEMTKKNEKFS